MPIKPLGRKQSIKNDDWLEAIKHIEKTVSKSEIDELAVETISQITNFIKDT